MKENSTNLGPRHIRQIWFIITVVQAVLQYIADFVALLQGPSDMALSNMSVHCLCSYLGKKERKRNNKMKNDEGHYGFITTNENWIQKLITQHYREGEGDSKLTLSQSQCILILV